MRLGTAAFRMAPHLWDRYQRETGRDVLVAPNRPQPAAWSDSGLHAAWLGHSTVLLRMEGITILTDPVFSERVGVNLGPVTLGPKRLVQAALRSDEVPEPDVILLSHAHMDHFDLPSLKALKSPRTRVITASRTSDLLHVPSWSGVTELAWG